MACVHAHSTTGLATSWALFKGVSIQEMCAAARWALLGLLGVMVHSVSEVSYSHVVASHLPLLLL